MHVKVVPPLEVQLLVVTAGSENTTMLSALKPRPVNVTEEAAEPGTIAVAAVELDPVINAAAVPDVAPEPKAPESVPASPFPGGVPGA